MAILKHYGNNIYGYDVDLTWGLLRAVGSDKSKLELLHDNVAMYYRYTAATPQSNWRAAKLVRAGLPPVYKSGEHPIFEVEITVQFTSHEHTYHVKETSQGREQIVMVPTKMSQPTQY